MRKAGRSSVWARPCQDVTPCGHAGVGVISLHGTHLSLPTLFDSSLKKFFRLGRAMRVVLPLGNGGIAHLVVICCDQGGEGDPEKLTLTDNLLAAVLAEAKMCCAVQPVILVGKKPLPQAEVWPPAFTCQSQLDKDKGSRRDFALACPNALAAARVLRLHRFRTSGTVTSKSSALYRGRSRSNS